MCQRFAHETELWLFLWPSCVSLDGGSQLQMADVQTSIILNSDLQHTLPGKCLQRERSGGQQDRQTYVCRSASLLAGCGGSLWKPWPGIRLAAGFDLVFFHSMRDIRVAVWPRQENLQIRLS